MYYAVNVQVLQRYMYLPAPLELFLSYLLTLAPSLLFLLRQEIALSVLKMTCDNICQRNMDAKRIYETKIINNLKKGTKTNIQTYKGQRWQGEN